jgi:hypothetical protein
MAGFVDLHKMIARKNAFSALPSAWNEGELEGGAKSGGLKCQKWKWIWIYKKSLN